MYHENYNFPTLAYKIHMYHENYVVREVPIRVGFPEGGSHKGGISRMFSTDGEHTSMGTSTYIKISSSFFLHSFLLVFLNFLNLSLSFKCFLNFLNSSHQKIFSWEHGNVKI